MPRSLILLLLLLSSVLYGLSFPPFNLSWLSWVSLVPLLYTSRFNFSKRIRFGHGLLAGFGANLIIFFWFWATFNAAGIGAVTTFSSWVAVSLVLAAYFGLFHLSYALLPSNVFRPWIVAAVWVFFEWVRSYILTGFPWALLAHTQVAHTRLIQIASFSGTFGVGFLIVLINAHLAEASLPGRPRWISRLLSVFLVVGALAFGAVKLSDAPVGSRTLRVALLQGNIDQYQKWDAVYEFQIKSVYESLAKEAMESKPHLIVWPESAVPGWLPGDKSVMEWITKVVRQNPTYHLVGAVSDRNGRETNSAFLFDPQGNIVGVYDKQHLVPFGEYIPFGEIFKNVVPYLGQLGKFDAGEAPVVFDRDGVLLAPNICYEAVFPRLVRKTVNNRADIIVNITNDGWYLNTGAPEQHYAVNIFRAIENRKPVLRAANTGISAIIDAYGREVARTKLMERTLIIHDLVF